ncbi:hypothetical protein BB561_001184 [Smittium simulii]|uniref:Uncharacterized protein n=1 Tax=Smittium simulii TaxID=133385 RepID=A0A2T9YVS3_9FUNG|nr:hypothetical protein BB561_001184 [Smittium simulii]
MLSKDKTPAAVYYKANTPYYHDKFSSRPELPQLFSKVSSPNHHSPKSEILNIVDRFSEEPKLLETILDAKSEENKTLAQREIRRTEEIKLDQRRTELEILKQIEYLNTLPGAREMFEKSDCLKKIYHNNIKKDSIYSNNELNSRNSSKYLNIGLHQSNHLEKYSMDRVVSATIPSQNSAEFRPITKSPSNSNVTADGMASPVYSRFELCDSPSYQKYRTSYSVDRNSIKSSGASAYHDYYNQPHPSGHPNQNSREQVSDHRNINDNHFRHSISAFKEGKSSFFSNQSMTANDPHYFDHSQNDNEYAYFHNKRKISLDTSYLPEDIETYAPATYLKQKSSFNPKIGSQNNTQRISRATNGLAVNTGLGALRKAHNTSNNLDDIDPMSAPVDFRPLKKKIVLREDVIQAIRKKVQNNEAQKKTISPTAESTEEKDKTTTKNIPTKATKPKKETKLKAKPCTSLSTSKALTSKSDQSNQQLPINDKEKITSRLSTASLSNISTFKKSSPVKRNKENSANHSSKSSSPLSKVDNLVTVTRKELSSASLSSDSVHVEDDEMYKNELSSSSIEDEHSQLDIAERGFPNSNTLPPISMARSSYQRNESS